MSELVCTWFGAVSPRKSVSTWANAVKVITTQVNLFAQVIGSTSAAWKLAKRRHQWF